jgi:hypothetical protein
MKRFWEKVDIRSPEECWEWQGSRSKTGYGRFGFKLAVVLAHRMCWFLVHDEHPNEKHVLHTCDNPSCVNPQHLRLGTHDENMKDATAKRRNAYGKRHGRRKLTEEEVLAIRASDGTHAAIAARYGVAPSAITRIRQRVLWRHL